MYMAQLEYQTVEIQIGYTYTLSVAKAAYSLAASHFISYYNCTTVTTREHYKSSCSIVLCEYLVQ